MNIEAMMAMRRVVVFIMIAVIGKFKIRERYCDLIEKGSKYEMQVVPELFTQKIPEVLNR